MTTVGLVGCAAAKLSRPAPARELYTSQLFRKAAAYAEQNSDRWYVLSAKYGLVHSETVIEPYDMKLGHKSGPSIWEWATRVHDQLETELWQQGIPLAELLILAGEQYRTFLRLGNWPRRVPMEGLGIGQQLSYLTNALTLAHQPSGL